MDRIGFEIVNPPEVEVEVELEDVVEDAEVDVETDVDDDDELLVWVLEGQISAKDGGRASSDSWSTISSKTNARPASRCHSI